MNKVLGKAGWKVGDVDLFEVNEAFACVAMFAMKDLGIPHDKINIQAAPPRSATQSAPAAPASSSPWSTR